MFPLFVPYLMCLQIASNISAGVFTSRASKSYKIEKKFESGEQHRNSAYQMITMGKIAVIT